MASKHSSFISMGEEEDIPLQKLQMPGPILASLLHRFTSSPSSVHGLLFGHFTLSPPPSLSDDDPPTSDAPPLLTATVTSFLSFPSHFPLPLHPPPPPPSSSSFLLGSFSGRRKTPLRPSLKETTTTISLSSSAKVPVSNFSLPPSLFFLLSTPMHDDKLIHTFEYKAFQYRISTASFEALSLEILNLGPTFRPDFGSFCPNSLFPLISTESRVSGKDMLKDYEQMTMMEMKKECKDQKKLSYYAEGFTIGRLRGLMGSSSARYTAEMEDLYNNMLDQLQDLASSVESSSAKLLEQEEYNMKLRRKVAGLE